MSRQKVYLALSADILHHGHINIFNKASELGDVIVGLLTDEAIAEHKRLPFLEFDQRKVIVENIKGVVEVIEQNTWSYRENLYRVKPDFVVHGDDWKIGYQEKYRNEAEIILSEWGGKVIDIPYTKDVNSSDISKAINQIGTTSSFRLRSLRRMLEAKKYLRFLDIHNGLSALIIENISYNAEDTVREFDGMWASSLTDSTAKGKPDIEAVDITSRISTLNEVLDVTTKPVIFDGDTGGKNEHFVFTVKTLERLGVSAVIIEDKVGLKKNSLFGTDVPQNQSSIKNFSDKIKVGKSAQATEEFMIIARIESLILKKGIKDALKRSKAYMKAGADAIMIHSKEKKPLEILNFCKEYNKLKNKKPLIVVPSTFSSITEEALIKSGVKIVIYANHLLRSAYPAMVKTAKSILKNKRSSEAEKDLMPIDEMLGLIKGTK